MITKRLFAAFLLLFGLMTTGAGAGAFANVEPINLLLQPGNTTTIAATRQIRGQVLFIRGILGIFSRGLDQMANDLRRRGVKTTVIHHTAWRKAAVQIINNHRQNGPAPIVLIGHSLGANAILRIAKMLHQRHIPVRYLVTFEPNIRLPVTSNIEVAVNYYLSNSALGVPLQREPGSSGSLKNVDLVKVRGIGHFNIEKNTALQQIVIRDVFSHLDPAGLQ